MDRSGFSGNFLSSDGVRDAMAMEKRINIKAREAEGGAQFVVGKFLLTVQFDEGGLLGGLIKVDELAAQLLLNVGGKVKGNSHRETPFAQYNAPAP
jgi:hypothetical protein